MSRQHQQQMAPSTLSQQSRSSQNPAAGLMSLPTALTTQQQQQQKLRLQRIQMERERIRMRQEELMRQVGLRCGGRALGPWWQGWWQVALPSGSASSLEGLEAPSPAPSLWYSGPLPAASVCTAVRTDFTAQVELWLCTCGRLGSHC